MRMATPALVSNDCIVHQPLPRDAQAGAQGVRSVTLRVLQQC
jgi:hypothetical protein